MPLPRPFVAVAALAIGLLTAPEARADANREIEQGTIEFQTGRYPECIQRFKTLLTPGSPDEAKLLEQRSVARMHLGACLMASKREAEADAQFEQLIRDDYRFSPDRASFPVSIYGRFLETRLRLRNEIEDKIRADQEREAALARLREQYAQLERDRQQNIEQMAREQISTQRNSRLVAMVPFGVGQFQNRQRTLGWVMLSTQAVFAATSAVTYFLTQNIQRQFSSSVDPTEATRLRDLAVQINYASFAALALTAAGGIVHAQITFVPEFREVRERPLPPPVPLPQSVVGGTLLWQGRW